MSGGVESKVRKKERRRRRRKNYRLIPNVPIAFRPRHGIGDVGRRAIRVLDGDRSVVQQVDGVVGR